MSERILVVEDAPIVRDMVVRYLQRQGFETLIACDGEEALRLASGADLVILDLMLPKLDGFEVCRRIRATDNRPIIMLTARGGIRDKLAGLGIGADDYLVKPFSAAELIARVHAVLRRATAHSMDDDIIQIRDLRIRARTRTVERGATVLELSEREFDLLLFLARHAGRAFTRKQLLEHVWDDAVTGGEQTVTVYVSRLREKIETNPGRPKYLKTAWGTGYKLET